MNNEKDEALSLIRYLEMQMWAEIDIIATPRYLKR